MKCFESLGGERLAVRWKEYVKGGGGGALMVEGGWNWVSVVSVLAVETVVVPVCQLATDSNCSDLTYPIYPADMTYVSVAVSQEV